MRGALEHQVLEEVREARSTRLLVLRADVVPDVDRDNRTVVILVHDHIEAVGELLMEERNVHGSDGRQAMSVSRPAFAAGWRRAGSPSGLLELAAREHGGAVVRDC